ncbi:galactinol synthase 1 [Quercus suber]|uniref:Hexosyltransferase n=1 Tax=Quercus suber TaxID=58331 RepID=A0AAW0LR81_QUESU
MGLFEIKPEFVEYDKMIYLDGDIQDFLNMYFKGIYKPIPPIYNFVLAMLWRHPENFNFDEIKVAHYCAAGSKPWRYTGKEENMQREDIKILIKKWWDIYEDESLDYKNVIAVSKAQPVFEALQLEEIDVQQPKLSVPKRAFVTFLAGNGDYLKGVVGLAKGLRKAKSAYPLVVAILPDVPEEHRRILESQDCIVREIVPLSPPENYAHQFAMAYYVINYSKLRIWEFVEYDKMIYLDGDIQVFDNIDHLFDLPDGHFYAVMDCFCENIWINSTQHNIGYCQQCPERVQWPVQQPKLSVPKRAFVTFLAGNGDYLKGVVGLAKGLRKAKSAYPLVVAILPDVPEEHRRILESQDCIVREIVPLSPPENYAHQFAMAYYVINYSKLRIWEFVEYDKMIYLDGDIQDFLNMYFKDIYKPIPPIYNFVLAMLWRHPENFNFDEIKVAHYCAAGSKPWRYTGKEENMQREDIKILIKKWWDIYEDESLDYKNVIAVSKAQPVFEALQLEEIDVVDNRDAPSAA